MADLPSIEAFEALVGARRSSLAVDPDRPVGRDVIERLAALVALAPNHKRTAPWLIAAFDGAGRSRLGELLAQDALDAQPDLPTAKLDKTRRKYARAPVVVVVGCVPDDDERRHVEDLHAVAAGVEHLLLGATALGLGTLWSSPPVVVAPRTSAAASFPPGTELVAVVYVGWPATPAAESERPAIAVTWPS